MILHALVVLRFGIKWRLFCINFVFKKTQNEKKEKPSWIATDLENTNSEQRSITTEKHTT